MVIRVTKKEVGYEDKNLLHTQSTYTFTLRKRESYLSRQSARKHPESHKAGKKLLRGISSVGRALAWHARGQRFDPAILHTIIKVLSF